MRGHVTVLLYAPSNIRVLAGGCLSTFTSLLRTVTKENPGRRATGAHLHQSPRILHLFAALFLSSPFTCIG